MVCLSVKEHLCSNPLTWDCKSSATALGTQGTLLKDLILPHSTQIIKGRVCEGSQSGKLKAVVRGTPKCLVEYTEGLYYEPVGHLICTLHRAICASSFHGYLWEPVHKPLKICVCTHIHRVLQNHPLTAGLANRGRKVLPGLQVYPHSREKRERRRYTSGACKVR